MIFILIILIGYVIWRNLPRENKRVIAKGIINTTEQSASLVNTSISKAKKSVEKSLSKSYLTSCSWLLNNDLGNNILYTFLNNNELLITTNGSVKKGSYQLIVDNNSILITIDGLILHYNIVNIKNDFLYLNKIASNEVLVFFKTAAARRARPVDSLARTAARPPRSCCCAALGPRDRSRAQTASPPGCAAPAA